MRISSPERARWAVVTLFTLHGMLLGAWVSHIPLAKERLAAGTGLFGLALLSIAAGAVAAMPVAGILIARFGSRPVTLATAVGFAVALFGPISAPGFWSFAAAGLALGAMIGSMDVAMNCHGLAVERLIKRPTMSIFHGTFSVGAFLGTFGGAAAMKLWGPIPQVIAAAGLALALTAAAAPLMLPADVDRGRVAGGLALPSRATVGLGLLCFLALMIEGSILDWGAIMMRERFALAAAASALAFGAYQGGMAFARLTGDWLRLKFGAVRVVAVSAWLTVIGTLLGLLLPSAMLSIAAFTLAGLGIGNIAPILFAGGGRLEPHAPSHGIAAVTTLGYAGFLAGPPVIGFAAELVGLTAALGLTVVAAGVIGVFARVAAVADRY